MHCHCFIPKKIITKKKPEKGTKDHIKTTKPEKLPTEHHGLEEKSVDVDPTEEGDKSLPKRGTKTGNFSSLRKTPSFLVNFRNTLEVRTWSPHHAKVNLRENNDLPCDVAYNHPTLKDLDLDKRLGVVETYMTVCTEGNYLRGEVDSLSASCQLVVNSLSTSQLVNFLSSLY